MRQLQSQAKSRRSPERITIAWTPFMAGAALAAFAGDLTELVFANLLVGLPIAVLVSGAQRSTGRMIRLLPRGIAAVIAANAVVLVVDTFLD